MSHPTTKPEAILQLEQELGFELTDLPHVSSDTNIDSWQSKTYACNQEGEVIQLNLTGYELEEIPNLLAFENLQVLNLSNNKISRIKGLDKLPELQSLDLSLNRLTQIEGLEQLLNIESLALGFNQLTRIEGLELLTKLRSLYLWYNRLTRIEGLEQLHELQFLTLRDNQLTSIEGLEMLSNLLSLDLCNNQLTSIEGLVQLPKLQSLNLEGNQLTSIKGLEKLTKLSFLYLGNNQLTCIEELGKLFDLYSLDLGSNQLRSIEGLEHLPRLHSLDLSGNQLKSIEGLEHLSKLHSLNLSGNQLKSIEGLEALEELGELDSSDNQISHTKGLDSLSKLRRLNLSRNQLSKIEGLEPLSLLESLDLSNNRFSVIENLPQTSLKELKVEGNDIKYIRRDLSDKESEQLPCRLIFTPYENHLEDIQRFQKRKPLLQKLHLPIKVMLLGNHSSGKSTFLSSLCKGEKETGSTHVLRVVKRGDLGANFYDFGGQDFYHGIYNAFYSTGALYVLFWRLALDRNSRGEELLKDNNPHREKVLNFNRNYWLGQIRYTNQQRSIVGRDTSGRENVLVIQTYADCDPQQNLKQTDLSVREEFYIALEREIKGTKGQQSLFLQQDKAAKQYLRLRMKEEIARLKEKTSIDVTRSEKILYNYILQKKTSLGSDSPIPIEDLLNAMPGYTDSISSLKGDLHQLYLHGEVIYYKDDKELSDLVWLDPEATVNYIHSEILNKEFIKKRGVVEKYLLPNKNKNLVRLLELEKIIYYNKNEDQYIIPGYLPLADDDEMYEWLKLSYLQPNITLKFEHFIPFGLINQLICYYGQGENDLKKFWRDQLFFTLVNMPSDKEPIKQGSNGSFLYEEDRGPETYPEGRYMVWISLNHEQLTIEVYIKPIDQGIEHQVSQVERMLLQDILDMYWSNLPPSNDEGYLSRRRREHRRLRQDFPIEDLYISTSKLPLCQERRLFVNLASIDHYDPNKGIAEAGRSRGMAVGYPLNEDGTLNKGQAQPISLRSFQHLTDNKHIGKMKKVFISYSKDDKAELKVCLQFFKPLEDEGLVTIYYDERTEAGAEIHPTIRKEIAEADVIVVLVSPSLLSTDYITRLELPLAKELGKRIYPFILKPCMWEDNKIIKPVYVALKGETGASEEVYIDKGSGAYVSESIQLGIWKKFMEEFKKKVLHINT
jgi:leucine-rich protein